jgi:hypothetical protein
MLHREQADRKTCLFHSKHVTFLLAIASSVCIGRLRAIANKQGLGNAFGRETN